MKLEIASEMIGVCLRNGLYSQGILDEQPPKIKCRSLQHLLRANKTVEKDNKIKLKKPGQHSIQMTVADRGLAAMYTAMNFEGGTPDEPNVVGYANGNYVLVIRASSFTPEPEF